MKTKNEALVAAVINHIMTSVRKQADVYTTSRSREEEEEGEGEEEEEEDKQRLMCVCFRE